MLYYFLLLSTQFIHGIFWGWKQFNGPRGRALTQNQVEKERWDNMVAELEPAGRYVRRG